MLAQNAQWLAQALVLVVARLNETGPAIRFSHGLAPQVSGLKSDRPLFYLNHPQIDVLAAKKAKKPTQTGLLPPCHDTWGAARGHGDVPNLGVVHRVSYLWVNRGAIALILAPSIHASAPGGAALFQHLSILPSLRSSRFSLSWQSFRIGNCLKARRQSP
jgi:hypothetical protein